MVKAVVNGLKSHPIPAFFFLTFGIAWSVWLPLGILAPDDYLWSLAGAWAPTVSGILLVGLSEGRDGLRKFLGRVLRWRVGIQWYLVVLFGPAMVAFLAIGAGTMLGEPAPGLTLPAGVPPQAWPGALPVIFLINVFLGGPLAEDIGWRGYILPGLRKRMPTLQASLMIGIIWAVWHLPYFVFPGWRSMVGSIPFLWFALLTTGWSVLFAWVYVNTESILMPVLFHAAINTTLGTLGLLGQGDGNLMLPGLNTLFTWMAVGLLVTFFGQDLKRQNPSRVERPAEGPNRT